MTAERARDRLERGIAALTRAGDDPAILSYALSAIHGALDAHFRSILASDHRVPEGIRLVALDVGAFKFPDVVSAMHDHLALPGSEQSYVLGALGHRRSQDRGDGFAWDRAGLERYAHYVARKLGEPVPVLSPPGVPEPAALASPVSPPAAPPTRGDGWADNWAGIATTRPYRMASALARDGEVRASHLLLIVCALLAVSLLWRWVESAAFDAASRAANPQVASSPTAMPSPAPGQAATAVAVASPAPAPAQSAAASRQPATVAGQGEWLVVGNTDGEGVFLRRTPSMDDRLEPYEDGTRMRVIGPDREAEGRRWKQVRVEDGLVGWVPAQYLIPTP